MTYNCPNCNEIMNAPIDNICECPSCSTMLYERALQGIVDLRQQLATAQARITELKAEYATYRALAEQKLNTAQISDIVAQAQNAQYAALKMSAPLIDSESSLTEDEQKEAERLARELNHNTESTLSESALRLLKHANERNTIRLYAGDSVANELLFGNFLEVDARIRNDIFAKITDKGRAYLNAKSERE